MKIYIIRRDDNLDQQRTHIFRHRAVTFAHTHATFLRRRRTGFHAWGVWNKNENTAVGGDAGRVSSACLPCDDFWTPRERPAMVSRCVLVALLTLGTADALGLGGNRRRLLKLGSAAGFLGGGVERLAGRGAAANAATPPVAVGETNSVVRVVGVV